MSDTCPVCEAGPEDRHTEWVHERYQELVDAGYDIDTAVTVVRVAREAGLRWVRPLDPTPHVCQFCERPLEGHWWRCSAAVPDPDSDGAWTPPATIGGRWTRLNRRTRLYESWPPSPPTTT